MFNIVCRIIFGLLFLVFVRVTHAEQVCHEVKTCATCCPKVKPKIVTKEVVVEKEVVKKVSQPYHVGILAGYGARGNLKESSDGVRTENGLVLGLQGQAVLKQAESYDVSGVLQLQTNRTVSAGVLVGF